MINENIIYALVCTLIFIVFWGGSRYLKYARTSMLKELVAWCVTKDSAIFRYNLGLWEYIKNAQRKFKLQPQYSISGDAEWEFAKSILDGFCDHLADSFFRDILSYKKFIWLKSLTLVDSNCKEHFFMFHLFCYLTDHYCSDSFLGHDMHQKTLSYESHGMWGGPLYHATYELTDFAVVVNKMRYIAFLFCKKSDIYQNDIAAWLTPTHFTDIIDTRQIDISRI